MKKVIKNLFCVPKYRTLFLFLIFIGVAITVGASVLAQTATPAPEPELYIPILSDILEAPIRIGVAVVVLVLTLALGIIQFVCGFLALVSAYFLKAIILMPVDLTKGGIVDVGWEFCRDIANMFFVIFLLVIAYATIFRKDSYAMRSLLPTLVLVAVLINFSQVICGVVIDICNILMNFFIKYSVADATQMLVKQNPFLNDVLGITSGEFWNPMSQMFGKPISEVMRGAIMMVAKGLVAVIFTIIEFFIIWTYALVLIIRIVVIWILVILSPLAFASYVLPATRKTFNQWWDSFLQWALMGVIMLFFLYLSGYLLEHTNFLSSFKITPPETNDPLMAAGSKMVANMLMPILPAIASIVLLILGLNMSFGAGSGAPGFIRKIMNAPGGMVGGLYNYGKNAALSALGTAGSITTGTGKDAKTTTWLDRLTTDVSGNKLGALLGAPALLNLKQRATKAAVGDFGGLESASLDTLNNLINNGTPLQQRNARAAMVSGAGSGKFKFGDVSGKIDAEQLKILLTAGVKNGLAFANKDIVKYAKVLGDTPHNLAKALSPKAFVDMMNESPSAGGNLGVVGALNEKKSKALAENGSDNAIAGVRNTLQGIASACSGFTSYSDINTRATANDAGLKAEIRVQIASNPTINPGDVDTITNNIMKAMAQKDLIT